MRVLFLTKYGANGPSSRYRVLQFLPYLAARGISYDVHALHEDRYLTSRFAGARMSPLYLARRAVSRLAVLASAPRYDVVFIQKEMFPHLVDLPERWLARRGVRYVVDLDDAIHLMYEHARGPLRTKMPRVLARASLILAGNRYLEEYARRYNQDVVFFPTVVDTERLTPAAARERPEPGRLAVGWMGTPETVRYLKAIVPALEIAAQRVPLSLLVVGAPAPASQAFDSRDKAWSEAGEADDLRAMDIGVMPLADDEWSRGKCSLKLIQYMSAGVASVTSPSGSAVEFVRDGENAWFAASAMEWSERIRALAESPQDRADMGRRARATVEAGYSLKVWGPRFVACLERAASGAHERALAEERKP